MKRFIVFILWAITYLKINFGVIRNDYFKILIENNQLLLKLLLIVLILIFFNREILTSFKHIKSKAIRTYSLIPAVILLLGNSLFVFLIFDSMEIATYSFSLLFIINTLIIGPVYEELIYRFIFINNNWHFNTKLTIGLLSTLIFTFSHRFAAGGNVVLLIQYFIMGIGLILIYVKTNNILYPIFTHFLYNSFVLLLPLSLSK